MLLVYPFGSVVSRLRHAHHNMVLATYREGKLKKMREFRDKFIPGCMLTCYNATRGHMICRRQRRRSERIRNTPKRIINRLPFAGPGNSASGSRRRRRRRANRWLAMCAGPLSSAWKGSTNSSQEKAWMEARGKTRQSIHVLFVGITAPCPQRSDSAGAQQRDCPVHPAPRTRRPRSRRGSPYRPRARRPLRLRRR